VSIRGAVPHEVTDVRQCQVLQPSCCCVGCGRTHGTNIVRPCALWFRGVLCCFIVAAQHNTYRTAQHCAVQYRAVQYSTAQQSTVQYSTVLKVMYRAPPEDQSPCAELCCTALCFSSTAQHWYDAVSYVPPGFVWLSSEMQFSGWAATCHRKLYGGAAYSLILCCRSTPPHLIDYSIALPLTLVFSSGVVFCMVAALVLPHSSHQDVGPAHRRRHGCLLLDRRPVGGSVIAALHSHFLLILAILLRVSFCAPPPLGCHFT
jgi:hypothetical protein